MPFRLMLPKPACHSWEPSPDDLPPLEDRDVDALVTMLSSIPVAPPKPGRFRLIYPKQISLSTFVESEHPRNLGKFAEKSGAKGKEKAPAKPKKPKQSQEEKDAASSQKFDELMATKTPADAKAFRSARADGIAIPPAWTEVSYHGKGADILAAGRDAKGRKQRAENPEYRQRISDANNARITKDLIPRMPEIRKKLRADAIAGNEEAKVLYLISLTGFRIGGKGDGKAKEQAFGASTLTGDHVKVDGDTVTFNFPGKHGVKQEHSVTDPVVAKMMKGAQPGKPIFNTKDAKVRAAWQDQYGGEKVHDIRHVVASEIAKAEINKLIPPPPRNEKDRKKLIMEVSTTAAKTLGNNPSQTLGTYIDPRLWDRVKVAA